MYQFDGELSCKMTQAGCLQVKLGGNCPLEMDEAIEIVESELASNIIGTIGTIS